MVLLVKGDAGGQVWGGLRATCGWGPALRPAWTRLFGHATHKVCRLQQLWWGSPHSGAQQTSECEMCCEHTGGTKDETGRQHPAFLWAPKRLAGQTGRLVPAAPPRTRGCRLQQIVWDLQIHFSNIMNYAESWGWAATSPWSTASLCLWLPPHPHSDGLPLAAVTI